MAQACRPLHKDSLQETRSESKQGADDFTVDIELPSTFDAEGDNVEIEFDFDTLDGYLRYDSGLNKILPDRSSDLNSVAAAVHYVYITLTDDNP